MTTEPPPRQGGPAIPAPPSIPESEALAPVSAGSVVTVQLTRQQAEAVYQAAKYVGSRLTVIEADIRVGDLVDGIRTLYAALEKETRRTRPRVLKSHLSGALEEPPEPDFGAMDDEEGLRRDEALAEETTTVNPVTGWAQSVNRVSDDEEPWDANEIRSAYP